MIHIEFTSEEKQALYYERFHHPHPRVQLKMEALWLKSQNLPHQQICQLTKISPNTLRRYLKDYQIGGIEKLKEINFSVPKSELEEHRSSLKEYFQSHPPATIKEAISQIESLTGIKRSPTQVRIFLKSMVRRCLKVGFIPSKADPEEQEEFKLKKLEPRLEEAPIRSKSRFFCGCSSLCHGKFSQLNLVNSCEYLLNLHRGENGSTF